MSTTIVTIFDEADPVVMARGRNYFDNGMVRALVRDGNCCIAKVDGSDYRPYTVMVQMDDNGLVLNYDCTCPYDFGPLCKHVVAVLLAIRDKSYTVTKTKASPTLKPETLHTLLQNSSHEQLCELLASQATQDPALRQVLLAELGGSTEDKLAAAKARVSTSIKRHTHHGQLNMWDCDRVCNDMDEVLSNAQLCLAKGQFQSALSLARYIFLTCARLTSYADSSSGGLGDTLNAALELIDHSASGLAKCGSTDATKVLKRLARDAVCKRPNVWDEWGHGLLRSAARLATTKTAPLLYAALDGMYEPHNKLCLTRYHDKADRLTRYYIVLHTGTTRAAQDYIAQNLDIDELREIAVQQAMDNGDFNRAEALCLECTDAVGQNAHLRPSIWHQRLFEVYTRSGHSEKQQTQAKHLLLGGELRYFDILRALLAKAGVWDEQYPKLLTEIKFARPAYEYMSILSTQNELALLMEQVQEHPHTVFQYGKQLVSLYPAQIVSLSTLLVYSMGQDASNRREYYHVAQRVRQLIAFGGRDEARAIIDRLCAEYPRRTAMLDELQKAWTR